MNSSELKGFLTGLIIGDGYIGAGVTARDFRIKSINEDFIKMIHYELSSCTNFNIIVRHFDAQYRDGVNHKEYWELTIRSHPYFAKKYHHFYDDYKNRTVSGWAMNWLTPYGLACWYMSDGYVCHVGKMHGRVYNRRIELCTDRYSLATIKRLCDMFYNKFGIVARPIKRLSRYRIRIMVRSYERFIEIIEPYIVPSMLYKLYLAYDKQPVWMSDQLWNFQEYLRSATTLPGYAEG